MCVCIIIDGLLHLRLSFFRLAALSTLSSLSPYIGGAGGGTAVTLYGSNFPVVGTVTVLFGSSFATVDDSVSTSTVMYCSTPASSSTGVVSVSLYVGGYVLSTNTITYEYEGDLFLFCTNRSDHIIPIAGSPVLTALVPDVIPQTGNVAVTLQGSNLWEDTVTGLNSVQLNGVPIDLSTAIWDTAAGASVVVIAPVDLMGGTQDVYQVTFTYNGQEFSSALPLTYVGELCTLL